jgi:hypothetical protein
MYRWKNIRLFTQVVTNKAPFAEPGYSRISISGSRAGDRHRPRRARPRRADRKRNPSRHDAYDAERLRLTRATARMLDMALGLIGDDVRAPRRPRPPVACSGRHRSTLDSGTNNFDPSG